MAWFPGSDDDRITGTWELPSIASRRIAEAAAAQGQQKSAYAFLTYDTVHLWARVLEAQPSWREEPGHLQRMYEIFNRVSTGRWPRSVVPWTSWAVGSTRRLIIR